MFCARLLEYYRTGPFIGASALLPPAIFLGTQIPRRSSQHCVCVCARARSFLADPWLFALPPCVVDIDPRASNRIPEWFFSLWAGFDPFMVACFSRTVILAVFPCFATVIKVFGRIFSPFRNYYWSSITTYTYRTQMRFLRYRTTCEIIAFKQKFSSVCIN